MVFEIQPWSSTRIRYWNCEQVLRDMAVLKAGPEMTNNEKEHLLEVYHNLASMIILASMDENKSLTHLRG